MDGMVIGAGDVPSPEIRQDLNLYRAKEDEEGKPLWHLHDPLANRFFQLQERDVELLALVGQRNAAEIADIAARMNMREPSQQEVNELFDFLRLNNLVKADDTQSNMYLESLENSRQRNWWELAIRNPLFFRIPLWKPDKFLDATLPFVSWLASWPSIILFTVVGLMGFYLLLRQIDVFFATFLYFFSWSGLATYLLVLLVVKIFHELGHAYTAKSVGCRVPVIGVAFMVGYPILYTDTSDAWKVPDKRKRLQIGVAGVSVELAIAVVSLFLWSITPDGTLRSALFLLATTTWLLSIFVNFNPLMRFDGYYLLSDLIDQPNLEPRSFAMAKWWLREKLFGLGASPPEEPRRYMVFFAFSVWIYRFLLFLGIALLVYSVFFKLAGILLFIAEIVYFILRPVYRELMEWWKLREQMTLNAQSKKTLASIAVLSGLLFIPWYSDVSAPAVFTAKSNDLYLPVAGRLVEKSESGPVAEDDRVFYFESPELDLEIEEVRNRYTELSWIRSSLGFDADLRQEALIVESELQTQSQRLRTLVERQEELTIVAPFKGRLVDIQPELFVGDWIAAETKLATVVDESDVKFVAYVAEHALGRIDEGMTAKFIPDSLEFGSFDAVVSQIEYAGSPTFDNPYLASTFGGDIAVRETQEGELLTVHSQYKIELTPVAEIANLSQVVKGVVVIDGRAESIFNRIRKRFTAVFIRETGF